MLMKVKFGMSSLTSKMVQVSEFTAQVSGMMFAYRYNAFAATGLANEGP